MKILFQMSLKELDTCFKAVVILYCLSFLNESRPCKLSFSGAGRGKILLRFLGAVIPGSIVRHQLLRKPQLEF